MHKVNRQILETLGIAWPTHVATLKEPANDGLSRRAS